jgi:GTPase SAR1 family protein
MAPVTLTADQYLLLPQQTSMTLVDSTGYDSLDNHRADLEIEKASVIVLLYDVTSLLQFQRLRSFWLPRILKLN